MSLYCRPAAQREIFAVTVSVGGEIGLGADTGSSLCIELDIFRILEGQERHEIGVMHDERFGGSPHQVPFGSVGGDDVADGVGNAAFESQRDSGERMA